MAQAESTKVDVSRFAKLSNSLAGSLRAIRMGIQERAVISNQFMRPLPLYMFEHAQLGRALGRLGTTIFDPRRIHMRQNLMLKSVEGRKFFLENLKESLKSIVPDENADKVRSYIDSKFDALIKEATSREITTRAFITMVNKAVGEMMRELNISGLNRSVRGITTSYFLNMHTFKSSDGRIALLDITSEKAYITDRNGSNLTLMIVSKEEIDKSLKEKGIDPEKAPKNLREIEWIRVMLSKLRNEGFKVRETKLADIRESMIIGRAIVNSISSGKDVEVEYKRMLEEDFKTDPDFYRVFQNKAMKELAKSINAAAFANTFMESFTKLPAKFVAMFARIVSAISRYVPIVGAVASTGTEVAAVFTEYGEAISEKIKGLSNTQWSVKDIVKDSPIIRNIDIPLNNTKSENVKSSTQNIESTQTVSLG